MRAVVRSVEGVPLVGPHSRFFSASGLPGPFFFLFIFVWGGGGWPLPWSGGWCHRPDRPVRVRLTVPLPAESKDGLSITRKRFDYTRPDRGRLPQGDDLEACLLGTISAGAIEILGRVQDLASARVASALSPNRAGTQGSRAVGKHLTASWATAPPRSEPHSSACRHSG